MALVDYKSTPMHVWEEVPHSADGKTTCRMRVRGPEDEDEDDVDEEDEEEDEDE